MHTFWPAMEPQASRSSLRLAARTPARLAVVLTLASLVLPVMAVAQPPEGEPAKPATLNAPPELSARGGAIPVRIIDGRLVISCDVSGPRLRVPVNLWLDFDGAYGFQLHNKAAANLPAETRSGKPIPLTLHFPDFEIKVARRELGPEEDFEKFTKYHSKEIGENALVGALGGHVLKYFDVIFDLPRERVEIRPAGGLQGRSQGDNSNEVITPITLRHDLAWLPVRLKSGERQIDRVMAVGTTNYDSLLSKTICNGMQRPAGNMDAVSLQKLDFAPYVAFRPADVILAHPDGVAGKIGINILKNFRLHVDRVSQLALLQATSNPSYPQEEFAWFQAMVAEDSEMVNNWLKKHRDTRLGPEAAEFLLNLLLDEGAEQKELAAAVQWINDTTLKDLRATRLFDLMQELLNEGETDLGIVAGKLGIKSARADRYPESNYKLHGRLGELLLKKDGRAAWRHLLSAAFGLPEDGMINLNLGRFYESQGKKRRAFSRYLQALVKEKSSELAMEALVRMDKELPPSERMTIESIDRMISGRVRNYTAPDSYDPKKHPRHANRTSVVEFFTNAYFGTEERGGAIGGALGNQGLISHFEPNDCVFLSYHLPAPKLEPLVNPLGLHMAKWLRVGAPTVQVLDGKQKGPGAGRHRHGERIYQAMKQAVVKRLETSSPLKIKASATLVDGKLKGQVTVAQVGFDQTALLGSWDKLYTVQAIVIERGVVFHGSSGVVIHRNVARGLATTGSLNGVRFEPDPSGMFQFSFERSLADIEKENQAALEKMEQQSTKLGHRLGVRIDPGSVEVVVVVRQLVEGAVVQAAPCELKRPETQSKSATALRKVTESAQ